MIFRIDAPQWLGKREMQQAQDYPANIIWSKLTIETLEKGMNYAQS